MKIPQAVINAIEAGTTQVTRRLAIYQPNRRNLWKPDEGDVQHRLIEGNVNINSGNDERRSIDLILDNTDNLLRPHPDGFWYDKIIKVYRGVTYKTDATPPTVIIMDSPSNAVAREFQVILRELGYSRVQINIAVDSYDEIADYDFVVSYVPNGKTTKTALLRRAYAAGKRVITIGDDSTGAEIPLINTTTASSGVWGIAPVAADTPLAGGWGAEDYDVEAGQRITSGSFTARIVALGSGGAQIMALIDSLPDTYAATPDRLTFQPRPWDSPPRTGNLPGIAVGEPDPNGPNSSSSVGEVPLTEGGRWFHYQAPIIGDQARGLFANALRWLWNKKPYSTFEAPVGVFMIDNFQEQRFPKSISITGRDLTKKALNSKIGVPIQFKADAAVEEIKAVLANAGLTDQNFPEHFLYDDPKGKISWDAGTSRWQIAKDLAERIDMEIFLDASGVVVGRHYQDPSTAKVTNIFKTGADGNLVDYTRSTNDSRLFNHVVVIGTDDDGPGLPPWGEAINDHPSSPTNVKRIGDRYTSWESAVVKNDKQAARMARRRLKFSALETYELSFDALAYPWVEAGEISRILELDRLPTDPDRFLVDTFSMPLGPGPMSGTGKRVTIVEDSQWEERNNFSAELPIDEDT